MAQKHLDDFSQKEPKPLMRKKVETGSLAIPPLIEKEEKHVFPLVAPQNLPCAYFVSATYDGRTGKALVKLYDPVSGQIYFWYDNTGHQPYCLTNLSQYELEKITRLLYPFDGRAGFFGRTLAAWPDFGFVFGVIGLIAHRIPAGIFAEVDISVLLHPLPDRLR